MRPDRVAAHMVGMNRILLDLTMLRSRLRNGTMTEADLDQAFVSAASHDKHDNGSNLLADLEALRIDILRGGADKLRILNRFIHQHEIHEIPSRALRDTERSANRERLRLADQAAAETMDIARALYPAAVDMVLSGSYGNFMLGVCRDVSGQLIEDSLNDGELTGLNRLLGLIRTEPSNESLVRDELSGSIKLVIKIAPPAKALPVTDPVHEALGFVPEPGQFNVKVVDQDKYWVDAFGNLVEIETFDAKRADRIVGYLVNRTKMIAEYVEWKLENAGAIAELSDLAEEYFQELLRRTPSQMLEDTRLMRALRALVAGE